MVSDRPIHQAGTSDGWHGVIEEGGQFPPERGRYLLYVGHFCPYAQRAALVRVIKGLEDVLDLAVVAPYPKGDDKGWPGWQFPSSSDEYPGATVDPQYGSKYFHELYYKVDKDYKGRFTVPLIWDKKNETIVNNESAEILRWLPTAFQGIVKDPAPEVDLYPSDLRSEIDRVAAWLQSDLAGSIMRAAIATEQAAYEKSVPVLFGALNKLEEIIHRNGGPYVLGSKLTEVDIRLYVTIVRFDAIYVQLGRVNIGTIRHDYPQIHNWLKNLYWNVPGFKETTDFDHIKYNYYKTLLGLNPKALIPLGPFPNVEAGFESDVKRVAVGGVKFPAAVEYAATLQ